MRRPADERFASVQDLHDHCIGEREICGTARVSLRDLEMVVEQGEPALTTPDAGPRHPASLTHWSFSQLCQKIGAPADYLRRLPAELMLENVNTGIKAGGFRSADDSQATADVSEFAGGIDVSGIAAGVDDLDAKLLIARAPESLTIRAINGPSYGRIWNADITSRLLELSDGWNAPPAMDAAQRPSGLYAGDRDMFAFLVNESYRIDDGSDEGLARGFFVWNSETGARSFGFEAFLYRFVCGNHMVWGAQTVGGVRIIHRGGQAAIRAFSSLRDQLGQYLNASPAGEEAVIRQAKIKSLGTGKDAVIDDLFRARIAGRKDLERAYERAERHATDNGAGPATVWGMAQGLSSISQDRKYAADRVDLDRAAGKILGMAA